MNRRQKVIGLIALFVAVLSAAVVWHFTNEPVTRSGNSPQNNAQQVEPVASQPANRPATNQDTTVAAPDKPVNQPPSNDVPAKLPEPPAPVETLPTRKPVSLKFVDAGNTALADVAFGYEALDADAYLRLLREERPASASATVANRGVSGTNGKFVFAAGQISVDTAGIRLVLLDARFIPMSRPADASRMPAGEILFPVPLGEHLEVIKLAEASSVRLYVEFADKLPFTGSVIVTFESDGIPDFVSTQRHEMEGTRDVQIPNIPQGATLIVTCRSARVGFTPLKEFRFTPVELTGVVTCTIPASSAIRSGLIVSVAGARTDDVYTVQIVVFSGSSVASGKIIGAASFKTLELWCNEGYRVSVRGKGVVWESGDIYLDEREVRTLTAELQACAEYVLQVQDESGTGLWPAIASTNTHRYPRWDSSRRITKGHSFDDLGLAHGDNTGKVVLRGVAPGACVLLVEAEGFEPKLINARSKPGEKVDLGIVKLTPATGEITVKLINRHEKTQYLVALMQPIGGPILKPAATGEETVKFSRLATRSYQILVYVGSGLKGVAKAVEVTAAKPEVTIEVDCSGAEHR